MRDRTDLYAEAFYAIILSEGSVNEVQDKLFRISRIIEGNDQLRSTLTDLHVPAARRQQVVEDLLEGKAHTITAALVSMVVAAGRIRELPVIVDHLLKKTAALSARVVAEVRTAVPLSDDQKARLATSLKQITGQDVDVMVIIDPSVLGGVITQIGDTVIDGSIRHRLAQLKESF